MKGHCSKMSTSWLAHFGACLGSSSSLLAEYFSSSVVPIFIPKLMSQCHVVLFLTYHNMAAWRVCPAWQSHSSGHNMKQSLVDGADTCGWSGSSPSLLYPWPLISGLPGKLLWILGAHCRGHALAFMDGDGESSYEWNLFSDEYDPAWESHTEMISPSLMYRFPW